MLTIADENLPFVTEAFSTVGEIRTFPGQKITPSVVRNADILVVRYITEVNEELLENSRVRFVGTASTGFDHIDVEYLRSKSIGFANAPGSNSNSVAEYVMSSLLALNRRDKISLENIKLGVVGVGNVGSKVVKKAQGLGIEVLQNDPPRARISNDPAFLPLDELMGCDVITLHVPLSRKGVDATYHLFDEKRLSKMNAHSILINTSRGKVVAESALKSVLEGMNLSGAVLDVWENEPQMDTDLLKMVDIGTPHIAGYSWDGRTNGTVMIYKAACKFFHISETWRYEMPDAEVPYLEKDVERDNYLNVMDDTVRAIYDIELDDSKLRKVLTLSSEDAGEYFETFRKRYFKRREFFNTKLKLNTRDVEIKARFRALGFDLIG